MPHLQSQMTASISGPRTLFILSEERRKSSALPALIIFHSQNIHEPSP
jgi:hypothetical protein